MNYHIYPCYKIDDILYYLAEIEMLYYSRYSRDYTLYVPRSAGKGYYMLSKAPITRYSSIIPYFQGKFRISTGTLPYFRSLRCPFQSQPGDGGMEVGTDL